MVHCSLQVHETSITTRVKEAPEYENSLNHL